MKNKYNVIITDEETEKIDIHNYVQKELDDMHQLTGDIKALPYQILNIKKL